MALTFGGTNNLITLSLSLSLIYALTASPPLSIRAPIYGFLCRNAREALLFFVTILITYPYNEENNPANTIIPFKY